MSKTFSSNSWHTVGVTNHTPPPPILGENHTIYLRIAMPKHPQPVKFTFQNPAVEGISCMHGNLVKIQAALKDGARFSMQEASKG